MPTMIPSNLEKIPFTTAGERKLYSILEKQLPENCEVRYEMIVGMRDFRPDLTIIDPERGILIIEVKDWGLENVTEANNEWFWVKGYHGTQFARVQPNPYWKIQSYLRETRTQLIAMPSLRDDKGKLSISVNSCIVFTNINREDFCNQKFDQVIPIESSFFQGEIKNDPILFNSWYQKIQSKLPETLSSKQMQEIRLALFPDLTIPRVTVHGFIPTRNKKQETRVNSRVLPNSLSLEQEEIAKNLGEGPRILRGIAGSGKTLIMLYRAKLMAANDPNINILILCWNVSLANYMLQVYNHFPFSAKGQVKITNISKFARNFESNFDYRNDTWITMALRKMDVKDENKYDAVFIDEAQDFYKEWIEIIFNKLVKGEKLERNFIVAADDAQRIYKERDFSWSSIGIPMTGRSKILKTIYRNSARVWCFSALFLKEKATYVTEGRDRLQFSSKGGYDPLLIECKNHEEQFEKIIELINKMKKEGYANNNVLILYHDNGDNSIETLVNILNTNNIDCDWISEDKNSKLTFNWDKDTVKISTVHSAKGMDSPVVIILGAEKFKYSKEDPQEDERNLLYVALTRAQEFLVVLYSGQQGIVPLLLECQKQYFQYRDGFISFEKGEG